MISFFGLQAVFQVSAARHVYQSLSSTTMLVTSSPFAHLVIVDEIKYHELSFGLPTIYLLHHILADLHNADVYILRRRTGYLQGFKEIFNPSPFFQACGKATILIARGLPRSRRTRRQLWL